MKNRGIVVLIGLALSSIAFMVGRWSERMQHGYAYKVNREKVVEFQVAPIYVRQVMEHVGISPMETETSVIEVDERTVYKAKRIFQENAPYVENVKVNNGLIEWDDGEYEFSLKMQKVPLRNIGSKSGTAASGTADQTTR
jgi:hypothetical protein